MKFLEKLKSSLTSRAFRVGGYSVAAALIVAAIVVAVNLLAGALPSQMTQYDVTSTQLFTLSEQSETLVTGLDSPVTIYWVVRADQEDVLLESLLERYASLSDRLTVVKKDPDLYPTFLNQYEVTSVTDNSLIVESGQRFRVVDASSLYEYEYIDYYSYDTSFAGEQAVTSAIDYVLLEELPKIYLLTGHGEAELGSTFTSAMEQENLETASLSLLTLEAVPEDADCVMIYGPQTDLNEHELECLRTYLQSGGKLYLLTDPPVDGELPNLAALMADYGVSAAPGIVVEADQNNYYWGTPYYLLPNLAGHDINVPLTTGGYRVLMPISQGLQVSADRRESVFVTNLLYTSDSAFSKVDGYALTTYSKEEGDIDGSFALAVAITETLDSGEQTQIIWAASSMLLDENANQDISGGNLDFFLNGLGWMCQQAESAISIRAKSVNYEYLTLDSSTASLLTAVVVGGIPLGYLGCGIVVAIRRKRT